MCSSRAGPITRAYLRLRNSREGREREIMLPHSVFECFAPMQTLGGGQQDLPCHAMPPAPSCALGSHAAGAHYRERERERYDTSPATQGWFMCQDIPWQIPEDETVCISTKKDKPMSQ